MTVFQGILPGPGFTSVGPGPSIFEVPTATGLYGFQYEPGPSLAVAFVVDGGAALTISSERYISGILDPLAAVDERIGFITDSFGSTAMDPTTLFGYLKRSQEFEEGDAIFSNVTGQWTIQSRAGSSMQVLAVKTLQSSSAQVTKT